MDACWTFSPPRKTAITFLTSVHLRWSSSKSLETFEVPLPTARRFRCPRCGSVVEICSPCDRNNVYCSEECASQTRTERHREANQRYQRDPIGNLKNRQRQQRFRAKQKQLQEKVTEQCLVSIADSRIITVNQNKHVTEQTKEVIHKQVRRAKTLEQLLSAVEDSIHCSFCGQECAPYVRHQSIGKSRLRFRVTPG